MNGRRLVVARDLGALWLALLEDARVLELAVSDEADARWLGAIAKGRITRLVPGVRAAFVDVGLARDIFTVMPPGTIAERHLTPGDEILVQVTREAQGGKGHRGTFEVTVPGRALVLIPGATHRGVSKRITDVGERERLRALLDEMGPRGAGLIARTAAAGLERDELAADLAALTAAWHEIEAQAAQVRAPAVVWREENPAVAFLRDHLALGIDEVIAYGSDPAELATALGGADTPAVPPIRAHDGSLRALEAFGLERAIATALAPAVPLPGGGRLVIEASEALVAIDVNSGRDTAAPDLEDTALRTNLEAGAEIGRQIRLRDLAGLIVVDFIDVETGAARAAISDALAAALASDRAKLRILPLTEFCLAQITRQRRRTPLSRHFAEPCPCCGWGLVPRSDARGRADVPRGARPAQALVKRVGADRHRLGAQGLVAEALQRFQGDAARHVGLERHLVHHHQPRLSTPHLDRAPHPHSAHAPGPGRLEAESVVRLAPTRPRFARDAVRLARTACHAQAVLAQGNRRREGARSVLHPHGPTAGEEEDPHRRPLGRGRRPRKRTGREPQRDPSDPGPREPAAEHSAPPRR